ncbi:MAG: TRAP transporter small permease subunit [Atribacterota bacterium]|nr:TRAP transporter small permease subunit [Atribacterota bacterium]
MIEIIGIILVAFILIISVSQVFMRYVLKISFWSAQELILYSMIYMVMLYGGVLLYKGQHFKLDYFINILYERFPKIGKIIKVFISLLLISFFIYLLILSWDSVINAQRQRTVSLKVSMAVPIFSVFLGFAICIYYQLLVIIKDLTAFKINTKK